MLLPENEFKKIIQASPLISIDLLIKNQYGEYLFGERINQPAKNYWFVPGGRILKDEQMVEALHRISYSELGIALQFGQAQFHGVWEHFYQNNFFNDEFTTHYIVLAYIFNVDKEKVNPPKIQHQNFKWLSKEAILKDSSIHEYSASYFLNDDVARAAE
ncbi:GDP-mannose mannosyl hydrolase [Enterobacter kobei]|uniref:GDP-mannose mannosyl hydrolase n=1 Tax=Enterobacter kobei TaxID=208224 RepID=UPI0028D1218C|nr:GDP-mannose mannosyl hydrolase [Enterobacter kobei]WNP36052.1 GDP-mannose mannosyl hydrolase [Enterobacter kobei]